MRGFQKKLIPKILTIQFLFPHCVFRGWIEWATFLVPKIIAIYAISFEIKPIRHFRT